MDQGLTCTDAGEALDCTNSHSSRKLFVLGAGFPGGKGEAIGHMLIVVVARVFFD